MVTARVWTTAAQPGGFPKVEDFTCLKEELGPCKDGEILIEAECFSVDPYILYQTRIKPVGSVVTGSQVAKVIESRNKEYPVGTYVIGYPGWRTHTKVTKEELANEDLIASYSKMPDIGAQPKSYALGVLGMPGNTAYFGFLELCKPKAGETVVVSAAAGAVGSIVCQIAKIKGCKVIAFAGSPQKVAFLKSIGVDHAFNYKEVDVGKAIAEVAPNGVHCYFDNVGGSFTTRVLPNMADYGRVAVCGAMSTMSDGNQSFKSINTDCSYSEVTIIHSQLRVEGFLVARWLDRWNEGIQQMRSWIEQGKLKYTETYTKGFENMPKAFTCIFQGDNMGKRIVTI